jgi:predicted GH43/DUF377 family glycosyl hydrolase
VTLPEIALRHDMALDPDPRRVILKLFVPGEDPGSVRMRASGLVERIARLDEESSSTLLRDTMRLFGSRHHDLESTFLHHFDLIKHRVDPEHELSRSAQLLLGAYFTHEYSVEAAALCNPSMVPHPDQSGLDDGQLRVVLSVRQIGEGHLSSIGFTTMVLGPQTRLASSDRSGPLQVGVRSSARHRRDLLAAGLAEEDYDNEVSATVLGLLPERFDDEEFAQTLRQVPAELLSRANAQRTLDQMRRAISESYVASFPPGTPLHQRVLWPISASERNGMEDARFVPVIGRDGKLTYRATYTAYDGEHIGSRMLKTEDFTQFEVSPMRGPGARNKGAALFPRPVQGRHLALCRSDGETLGLTAIDEKNRWQDPVPLLRPDSGWNLIQVGNCGSPMETDAGWLVLTHGVGPMRRYAIGALLLDLDHPEKVVAELASVLLSPHEADREGYVPNVVYSCGGLIHDGHLWLPYGASDARIRFATVPVAELLGAMRQPSDKGSEV